MLKRVPISVLRVGNGIVLASPMFCDSDGTNLVDAGVKLTQRMVERLKDRGIAVVVIDERDLEQLTGKKQPGNSKRSQHGRKASRTTPTRSNSQPKSSSHGKHTPDTSVSKQCAQSREPVRQETPARPQPSVSSTLDHDIAQGTGLRVKPSGSPFAKNLTRHGATSYNPETVSRFTTEDQCYLGQLVPFLGSLAEKNSVDVNTIDDISKGTLRQVAEDMDLVLCRAALTATQADLFRHSHHVSKLATSIGATIGFDEATLTELSIGCLIHDVGMLKVDHTNCQHTADKSVMGAIRTHPEMTLKLLQQISHEIPKTSLIVARQMHERCNGSGYPHGHSKDKIHDLAMIAAVADMFTALVTPGPRRDPVLPYHAMMTILHDVKNGLFDSDIVRAMLDTLSAFPVGSFVELSDQRVAQVIRPNRSNYNRPIVELCCDSDQDAVVIDLAKETETTVTRPVAQPVHSHT